MYKLKGVVQISPDRKRMDRDKVPRSFSSRLFAGSCTGGSACSTVVVRGPQHSTSRE